jgi:hypothetical protein
VRSRHRLLLGALVALVGCTQVIGIDGDYTLLEDDGGGGSGTGTGTGTGAMMCPAEPTPDGGACPAECSGGCNGGTCLIDCGASSCDGVTCPSGFTCDVDCAAGSCDGATIDCPPEQACEILCEGAMNCRGLTVNCGGGPCLLTCSTGNQVCRDSNLSCGEHRCQATCSQTSNQPDVSCNDSCDCRPC